MKFLTIFIYLITASLGYSIERPDIKNIVINKDPKSYKDVIFKDEDNYDINLENYRNKLLILNFWATWCAPCKEEMPSLDLLKNNKNLNNIISNNFFKYNNYRDDNKKKTKSLFQKI